jgi:homoserine O-acetyltransferase
MPCWFFTGPVPAAVPFLTPEYVKALFDPGQPLDARRYYLIFPDNLGHGNSSKPSDGMRASFPHYGYDDLVDLQHKLVTETLGIKHLHAILGMSMGGRNAWQWAEAYPDAMDGVMPVVSLPVKAEPAVAPHGHCRHPQRS